jgi:hypothetical protein
MDLTSIIEIVIAIAVVYLFIRFVASPVIRVILGIITFLVIILILQQFFNFDLDKALIPLGIHLNLNKWVSSFNWILGPANYYIELLKTFLGSIWQNFPKSLKL